MGELPTHLFLKPLEEGQEVALEMTKGREVLVKLVSLPPPDAEGNRQLIFELNGERWFVPITDTSVISDVARREKASGPGEIGSPMPGVIVNMQVKGELFTHLVSRRAHTRPVPSPPHHPVAPRGR